MRVAAADVKRLATWTACAALLFLSVRVTKIARYRAAGRVEGGLVGVMHVHSIHSDGGASLAQIAAKATQAGLDFIITTDHGNPSRPDEALPADPIFIAGSELATDGGHLLAVNYGTPTYNFPADPDQATADIRSEGGFSVIAHPMNARIPWTRWPMPPATGMEVFNGDSEWREVGWSRLARVLPLYWLNPVYFHLQMYHYPSEALRAFDREAAQRVFYLFSGLDAHDNVRLSHTRSIHFPDYLPLFQTVRLRIPPGVPKTREGVLQSLSHGRFYLSLDGIGTGAGFAFSGSLAGRSYSMGETMPNPGGRLEVTAEDGSRVRLLLNGKEVATGNGRLTAVAASAGAYRVEVYRSDHPFDPALPWILSNPIFVGSSYARPIQEEPTRIPEGPYLEILPSRFHSEAGPSSDAEYDGATMRFKIGKTSDPTVSPFVALCLRNQPPLNRDSRFRVRFTSDRVYRMWFEIHAGPRVYRTSIKSGPEPMTNFVDLARIHPSPKRAGATADSEPPTELYFVLDKQTVPMGTAGHLRLESLQISAPDESGAHAARQIE
ncbi:MAG: hypothetical protein HYX75_14820 [Acidobacteria bacterium]|nr:hypothetical protein [Acidobacteriota bacterium]